MRKGVFEYQVGRDIFRDVYEVHENSDLDTICGELLDELNTIMPVSSVTFICWLGIQ